MSDNLSVLYVNEEKISNLGFSYVAAIDFGTSNSGVAWGYADKEIASHLNDATATQHDNYAKVPTVLLVHKSILENLDALDPATLHINSHEDDGNIFYGHAANEAFLDFDLLEDEQRDNWVRFEHFKMALHEGDGETVVGSDGKNYNLERIIELYIRCLVEATYDNMAGNGIDIRHLDNSQQNDGHRMVRWGVTIPTIWDVQQKTVMENAIQRVLGEPNVIFLLEPEGAAMSFVANDNIQLNNGTTFMIVDCGGGTTDIVVQRVVQKGNQKSMEEVLPAHGNGVAGWEMDRRFYTLLATSLAEKSEGQIASDQAMKLLIDDFLKENPAGKVDLDGEWIKYKHNVSGRGNEFNYQLPPLYTSWLCDHYPELSGRISGRRGMVLRFERQVIEDKVFQPVCRDIMSVVQQVYDELEKKKVRLDYVFGAGGLIGLPVLQEHLREECPDYMDGDSQCLFACTDTRRGHRHGGSIMEGAACMLVFDECIQRVAKRFYYLLTCAPVRGENMAKSLWNKCELYKQHLSFDAFKNVFQEESKYQKHTICQSGAFVEFLQPIVLPNILAGKFDQVYSPIDENQEKISFKIYSSTKLHVFPSTDITDLRKEHTDEQGLFTIQGDSEKEYRMVVDFNEFQQNYFDVVITHNKTHESKVTIRISPELRRGH